MITSIPDIARIAPGPRLTPLTPSEAAQPSETFGKQLGELVSSVNQQQINADTAVTNFLSGNGGEIHQVMLAMEQARLSTQMVVEVRNKLVDAYQEISRMSV